MWLQHHLHYLWFILIILANAALTADINKDNDSKDVPEVTVKVVVGIQDGWRKDRIEEHKLLTSATRHDIEVQIGDHVGMPCETENDNRKSYILVFFPRAEGLLTAPVETLKEKFTTTGADILLPQGNVNGLIGWSGSISRVAKALGATSLASLAQQLSRSSKLRSQHNVQIDETGDVTYTFDDSSNVGSDGLQVAVIDGSYELVVHENIPCVLFASPDSEHGRMLLLAVSDYLDGSHRPNSGCVSCKKADNVGQLNDTHTIMVGVFITRPQPFLEEALSSLVRNGLPSKHTHFFIYNQVEEYKKRVAIFVESLETFGDFMNITYLEASGLSPDVSNIKNMALKECLRINCSWYVNFEAYAFINPDFMTTLLSLDHPVIAPALRVQKGIPATFWRDVDAAALVPAYSWDHSELLNAAEDVRGYWHSSCIRGIYAIGRTILESLSDPYTVRREDAKSPPAYIDTADMAFCAALRDNGIPMVVTNAFPNTGVLVNISNYKMKENNLDQYTSNPVLWMVAYGHKDLQSILSGNITPIKRPCHEVYEVPVFNELFAYDMVQLAKKTNRWSPAMKRDPRKEFGIEPVPTVDQLLSQLGVAKLFNSLYAEVIAYLQSLCYPHANPNHVTPYSLVARFKPDELPGLPSHHDSSIVTFYVNLTPEDQYEGGEVEFPLQDCKVKAGVGHLLVFPGRMSHPKLLHNVTEGVLYKAMIFSDELSSDESEKNSFSKKL